MGNIHLRAVSDRFIETITAFFPEKDFNPDNYSSDDNLFFNALNSIPSELQLEDKLKILKDINAKNKSGKTALQEATLQNNIELVNFLIYHGADVNVTNISIDDYTALHYATLYAKEDTCIIEALLSADADCDARTIGQNQTPLHLLFKHQKARSFSYFKAIKAFAKYGAHFNATDYWGLRPLDYALDSAINSRGLGREEGIKGLILNNVINVNTFILFQKSKSTLLHYAFKYFEDPEIIEIILRHGADIDVLDNNNKTPLHCAIKYCHKYLIPERVEWLRCLLKYFPDVNLITADGYNILTFSIHVRYVNHLGVPVEYKRNLMPDYLWQAIVEHLAKLQSIKQFIHPNLLQTISENSEYKNYFQQCTDKFNNNNDEELILAKNSKLHSDSHVTFFNLLTDDENKLLHYAANFNLVLDFEEYKIIEKFPHYGVLIHRRFTKAIEKRHSEKILNYLLPAVISSKQCIIDVTDV